MRAIVRVFLTLPTKSVWGSLTDKKLSVGKLFICICTKKFFLKCQYIRMKKTGPHHFPETSVHRNVISPNRCFAETSFYRIVVSPKKNITKRNLTASSHSRIVELPKLHYAERHFSVLQPNVIFPNRCIAERTFHHSLFSRTSFSRIVV